MAKEIERKFLVDKLQWDHLKKPEGNRITQAYIYSSIEKTIRVRINKNKGFLTIKGKTEGIARAEYEYEIPVSDAQELIANFSGPSIDKIRYAIPFDNHIWEVDVFFGENEGLLVAEIELKSENESFEKPFWIGEEVSHDARYYNANLEKKPYTSW